jgi:hypothetical protein
MSDQYVAYILGVLLTLKAFISHIDNQTTIILSLLFLAVKRIYSDHK